jgi:hypothetical protein
LQSIFGFGTEKGRNQQNNPLKAGHLREGGRSHAPEGLKNGQKISRQKTRQAEGEHQSWGNGIGQYSLQSVDEP